MQRPQPNHQTTCFWCVGLLLATCLQAAQAQAGHEFGSYGAAGTYGQYGYGTYGYGEQLDTLSNTPEDALFVSLQYSRRTLLADASQDQIPAVQSTVNPLLDDTNNDADLDIVPQEMPVTKSWDSMTLKSWEDWFAEHVDGSTAAAAGSTPGHYGSSGTYGYSADSQYGYASGSYGTVGAYFDFRSNKAYIPEIINDQPQQQQQQQQYIREQGAVPDSASSSSSHHTVSVSHIDSSNKPTVAGVSRGRGLAVQQYRSESGSTDLPVQQQQLSESAQAVQVALLEPPVGPVVPYRRLLRAIGGFNRRLHMNRESAEEALWAFRG